MTAQNILPTKSEPSNPPAGTLTRRQMLAGIAAAPFAVALGPGQAEPPDLSHRQQLIIDALAEAAKAVAGRDDEMLVTTLGVALFNLPESISRMSLYDSLLTFRAPRGDWDRIIAYPEGGWVQWEKAIASGKNVR